MVDNYCNVSATPNLQGYAYIHINFSLIWIHLTTLKRFSEHRTKVYLYFVYNYIFSFTLKCRLFCPVDELQLLSKSVWKKVGHFNFSILNGASHVS